MPGYGDNSTRHGADICYLYETDAENVAKMRQVLQDFARQD